MPVEVLRRSCQKTRCSCVQGIPPRLDAEVTVLDGLWPPEQSVGELPPSERQPVRHMLRQRSTVGWL
eukprot:CAMPEP_0115848474 /NCGR_PEP_ID=MMETSP0287-20121206/10941_1 /TAXON_ID=412157 /ORGANISM="Chrysochromulina rotalis, Strain UIO044" /LENGTH=66 /DNA_ID=CAMNT_0003302389 /DNA_START=140 /DNA_END=337 /DNA_ORIENTATION=+